MTDNRPTRKRGGDLLLKSGSRNRCPCQHCGRTIKKPNDKKGTIMKFQRIAVLLVLMLFSGAALAQDYYVDITNHTGYTIMYMYVSPGNAKSWEEDVLGQDILRDGVTQRVNLYGYRSPVFDIRLVDEDGDTYTYWDIDVSRHDLVVTLEDLD
jgi:hypothetical protein